ncbi:hypothetical protein KDL29_04395 [bacterium]|nr:hypothetical protein [bacterium]
MPEMQGLLPLIALLPLLAAGAGLLMRRVPAVVTALLGVLSLVASAGMALAVNAGLDAETGRAVWMVNWISGYTTEIRAFPPIPLALRADYTQVLFILTTCLIGVAVLLYAIRERRADPKAAQFHALLTFFCGSMLLFLVSDTLILLYIAWEMMGLAGYLLIRHKGTPEANRAARQAFWTTRATDFGLLFAIFIFMFGFGRFGVHMVQLSQVSIGWVAQHVPDQLSAVNWMIVAGLLVLLAVLGKAALLPLSFWLPDAMVAPAPVSALLHSATLVAAGPLLASDLLFGRTVVPVQADSGNPGWYVAPLAWAVMLGGLTMLMGSIVACCQQQPKKLLAWSTVSQLGLCVMGSGALAMEAARFQLLAHAWFKAALFLAVGIVVARWHEAQATHNDDEPSFDDLRQSPASGQLFWLALLPAGLSLAGVIGLAGYFGKDQILSALLSRAGQDYGGNALASTMPAMPGYWQAGALLLIASIPFTAAYCARLLSGLMPSPGKEAANGLAEQASAGNGWAGPTVISILLALIGSIGIAAFWPSYRAYFEGRLHDLQWAGNFEPLAAGLSVVLVLAGAVLGFVSASERGLASPTPLLTGVTGFFREGLYLKPFFTGLVGGFGEFLAILAGISDIRLIDWLSTRIGRGGRGLANASAWLDLHFVDGIRWWCCEIWWIIKRLHGRYWQNGQIQNYMFVLLLGAVLMCIVVSFPLNETLRRIIQSFLGRYE